MALLLGCQNQGNVAVANDYVSVSGLLTSQDTLVKYEDLGLKKLSDYGFFKQPISQLIPASEQVVPYTLNSPLFTDYATKSRFISFPEGSTAAYVSDEKVLDFPEGTVIIKNFYYTNADLKNNDTDVILETRLLLKKDGEWIALPYVWNEEQTEAYLYILGKDIDLVLEANDERVEPLNFSYSVPNINMCKNCHVKNQKLVPLGPTPRQLNRENQFISVSQNQLAFLSDNHFLVDLPPLSVVAKLPDYKDESEPLDGRARAYLDVNCAHCHQDGGSAKTSGLHLAYEESDLYRLGVNKPPVAAGKGSGYLAFDIVSGKPEASILLYRMKHLEPDIVMPEIGKNLVDTEGVALIESWIKSL
ncbi:SO2930 family diheme c-type cytochrome [Neolewinella persica]|uniref:SO2930 family diheme c-type cytochrome n=1 Tax=Neolewinella persica TaxID=70998 RepID=UPI00146C83AD|nr:SO2930 family diheme c-type cytochrome [Neolewinella persica]